MVLDRLRHGWEQSKLRAWLQKEMPANPAWRVMVLPDLWLCPICLEAGAQFRKAEDLYEAAAIHLAQMCEKYKTGQREPAVSIDRLQATARYLCAEEKVATDQAWQQRNQKGLWHCPYCLKETPARLAANGAADRAALENIARHLQSCPRWENGHGKPAAAGEVRNAALRSDLLAEAIQLTRKKIADSPVWQVRSSHSRWVCPFCRHIIVAIEYKDAILPPETLVMQVAGHLANDCEAYRTRLPEAASPKELKDAALGEELLGDPAAMGGPVATDSPTVAGEVSPDKMDPSRRLLWMKDQVLKNRAWQQRTSHGSWICPFCARETDAQFPLDGKINMAVVERLARHVEHCFAFEHGRGTAKTAEQIAALAREADAAHKAAEQVRAKMTASPVWRVKNEAGKWTCPYCRQPVLQIDISTDMALEKGAPPLIAKHLIEHCAAYKAKQSPATSVEELLPRTPKLEPAPVPISPDRTPVPEELMRSINAEIESVKAKAGLSDEMKKSLEEAKRRQLQMLPSLPDIAGLEFSVIFKACSHVAGDFYDFIEVNPRQLGILMGDVSGHGIEAGMVMAITKKVINMTARGRPSPRETLVISNPMIYPDIDRRTFITGIYLVLDLETKVMRIARAGHNPLILFNPERAPTMQALEPRGMAIGMDRGPRFEATLEEQEIKLQSGDVIFLYTDGLAEATNMASEEYGLPRILEAVQKYGKYDMEYLLHRIDLDLTKFRGEKEMDDDITLLGIKLV